jgi:N-acetylmuramoyl-L-alanine amidase
VTRRTTASVLALALLFAGLGGEVAWAAQGHPGQLTLVVSDGVGSGAEWDATPREAAPSGPLAGETVVIDPGHQLGNHNYPRKINRPVPAGGFRKPCNTTGTATNGGFAEATFAWRVSRLLRARLVDLGARVLLTRHSNRQDRWGPCVDTRGRDGNRADADLKISIHGDGSYTAGAHGFHVIAPTDRKPWTHDIYRSSKRLAVRTRAALRSAGVPVANYIAGGDGLDFRSDLGTLNLSDIPTVMVELGNMRNPRDAHRMTSAAGRATYARALDRAVRRFLG